MSDPILFPQLKIKKNCSTYLLRSSSEGLLDSEQSISDNVIDKGMEIRFLFEVCLL